MRISALLTPLLWLLACQQAPGGANAVKAPSVANSSTDPSAPVPAAAVSPAKPSGAQPMPQPIVVDVWHDTVCPWCRIGLHNVEAAAVAANVAIELRLHPYQLDPDTPPEGRDLRAWLTARYGGAQIDAMFARVTQVGAAAGVHFDFAKVRRGPNTLLSHATIGAAPTAVRDRYVNALHAAYFERGEDIGDVAVLAGIADAAGWSGDVVRALATDATALERVRADAAGAGALGIRGVPHVQIGGETLHGAQPVAAFAAALQKAANSASHGEPR